MTTDIRFDLGWVFAVWLVIANALWWWGPAGLERLFGPGQLWAGLIPLACLAALYPRRAATIEPPQRRREERIKRAHRAASAGQHRRAAAAAGPAAAPGRAPTCARTRARFEAGCR